MLLHITLIFSAEFQDINGIMYKNGNKYSGKWTQNHSSGKIRNTGRYQQGYRQGNWLWYTGNGKIECMGNYQDGERNGRWSWYYPNGVLSKLQFFTRGNKTGSWYEFYESGQTRLLLQYDRGEFYRNHTMWYPNGSRKYQQTYKKIKEKYLLESISIEWYENGSKRFEGYFNNGEAIGPQKWYWHNGHLMLSGFAFGEKLIGEWIRYYSNGQEAGRMINPDNDWVYSWIPLKDNN
ncbi:MAG: hypothetical protein KAI81_00905 [Candidatus Marinimicrobia bacterium]|nr:hypothetical protein [Candidatus Neomarinimicrobiota bacterium]